MKNHLALLEIRMTSLPLTARGGDLEQAQMQFGHNLAPEPIHRPLDEARVTVRFAENGGEFVRSASYRFANNTKRIHLL
ncbi:MAG: hypothetical protein ACK4Q5_13510 [Saprospiraceae bacterium]